MRVLLLGLSLFARCLAIPAFATCATTPDPPPALLPPALDVDALVPARAPTAVVSPDAKDFPDTPVEKCGPGPGVLLSERSYITAISDRAGRVRAEAEAKALRELRRSEQLAYQAAFDQAIKEARAAREREANQRRWESWKVAGGVLLGGAVAGIVATAAARGTK